MPLPDVPRVALLMGISRGSGMRFPSDSLVTVSAHRLLVCHLWRIIYSNPLSIFYSGHLIVSSPNLMKAFIERVE